jgi:hypothetical protein
MIYHSVAEIFDSIDETRVRLNQRLAGLTAEQENFRPASGGWSISEIAEHLSILEARLLRMMTVMITKAESADPQPEGEARGFQPVSLDQFVERSLTEKYVAPETVRPQGAISVSDALERLRQSRAGLNVLRPRIEASDLTGARYSHPAFGPLNLYQWLVLIGVHEDRHLRQIEALISSPEYGAATASA